MIYDLDDLDEDLHGLERLAEHCANESRARGFHSLTLIDGIEREMSPGERMALIHSEVSEMLEEYRKDENPASEYYDENGKPQGVAFELADVIIRCFDYAGRYGINLFLAVGEKLAYNAGREHKHGKVI